jgi:hypothetical protein
LLAGIPASDECPLLLIVIEKKNDESKVCHCEKCSEKRLKKSKQKPKTTFLRIAR